MWPLVLLAVTQIIFEMAPVSSSGHVALLMDIFKSYGLLTDDFFIPEWLEYIFNIPTFIVLLLFFRHEIKGLLSRFISISFNWIKKKKLRWSERYFMQLIFQLFLLVIVADLITAIPYFFCKYFYACGIASWQQITGFLLTGLGLLSLRWTTFKPHQHFNLKNACILGLAQGAAKLLLVSRMGITLVTAQQLGFSFRRSLHLSFCIYAPLLFVAILKGLLSIPHHDPLVIALIKIPPLIMFFLATILSYCVLYFIFLLGIKKQLWRLSFYLLLPLILSFFF